MIRPMRGSAQMGTRWAKLILAVVVVFAAGPEPSREAAAAPACTAGQLRASGGLQGAAGSQLGGMSVTNRAATACALPSKPRVSLAWRGRKLAVRQVPFPRGWLRTQYPAPLTRVRVLAPRHTAYVVLQWWNWCGARPWGGHDFPGVAELRLSAHRGTVSARLRDTAAPFCNAPPSTLRVSAFLRPPR
jgi:hypothetical protein